MIVAIFILSWILAGLIAFFMSIYCFAFSGTITHKIIGFLIAFFLGPFYWIYYGIVGSQYCNNNS